MLQLILHGIGDYYLQTDFQALNKKKKGNLGLWCCLKHCITYSLLFFIWRLIDPNAISSLAVLFIFITHFAIDRTNFVAYLIAIKNNCKKQIEVILINECIGEEGEMYPKKSYFKMVYDISNFGYSPERPFAITIWLYIICDNILHIICNYIAIKYL